MSNFFLPDISLRGSTERHATAGLRILTKSPAREFRSNQVPGPHYPISGNPGRLLMDWWGLSLQPGKDAACRMIPMRRLPALQFPGVRQVNPSAVDHAVYQAERCYVP